MLDARTKQQRDAALHKTKMCKFFQMNKCSKGEACTFAHSAAELLPLPGTEAAAELDKDGPSPGADAAPQPCRAPWRPGKAPAWLRPVGLSTDTLMFYAQALAMQTEAFHAMCQNQDEEEDEEEGSEGVATASGSEDVQEGLQNRQVSTGPGVSEAETTWPGSEDSVKEEWKGEDFCDSFESNMWSRQSTEAGVAMPAEWSRSSTQESAWISPDDERFAQFVGAQLKPLAEEQHGWAVKNTFLDFAEDEALEERRSSLRKVKSAGHLLALPH